INSTLYPTLLFEYPSISALATWLAEKHGAGFSQESTEVKSPLTDAAPPVTQLFRFDWLPAEKQLSSVRRAGHHGTVLLFGAAQAEISGTVLRVQPGERFEVQ